MSGPRANDARGSGAWRWLVVAALALSLCANFALVKTSNSYFKGENAVRLDPAGLNVYAAAPLPAASKPVLVFFGDSRALMWGHPEALHDYEVVNRGVGNQTTAQILLRFDADVPQLKPAIVVLQAGVNDLKTIAQFPERRVRIVADCESNLRRIVDRSRETGATVVVVSVFAIGDLPLWRLPFWSDDVRAAVREVNAFLPSLVGKRVVLMNADPALNDARGKVRPQYQLDYLHLNPAAYGVLTDELVPLLRGLPR